MTTENNKIIAEFMGKEVITEQDFLAYEYENIKDNTYIDTTLKYHSDWNWLMEAYMKCQEEANLKEGVLLKVFNELFHSMILFNNIKWIYDACVEFIKYYNQNKN